LRTLARRWQQLQAELTQLDSQLQDLVASVAPTLVALPGVGVDTAGQLLVTAGDNPNGCAGRPPWRTGAASPRSRRPRAAPTATGSTAVVTAKPTTPCGASPWSACPAIHQPGLCGTTDQTRPVQAGHHALFHWSSIGGVTRSPGSWLLGRRQGTASLLCRQTASFSSAAPGAPRP
jgi:hypothetical protein